MRSDGQTEDRARQLRKHLSPPELRLWLRLRERLPDQPAFRRQHAIGPFIADFYCAKARLVVEIDGSGHGWDAQTRHDARRDAYMQRLNLTVHRISAREVLANPGGVALRLRDMARLMVR